MRNIILKGIESLNIYAFQKASTFIYLLQEGQNLVPFIADEKT